MRSYSGYVKVSEKMTTGMLTVRGNLGQVNLKLLLLKQWVQNCRKTEK